MNRFYRKQIYQLFLLQMINSKTQPANVKVFCRFRPFNYQELQTYNPQPIYKIITNQHLQIKQPNKGEDLSFLYDKIFGSQTTQQQIYKQVGAPVLQNIMDGFNGTIMAYGQTSSGKTYTVQGISNDPKKKGIIPRMIQDLFLAIEKSPACIEYKLKVSIMQLYMEKLYDLIDCNKVDLKIRESKIDGPYVQGKTQVYISDKNQLIRLMNIAHKNRVTCVTSMNSNSSRSHLIFQLNLSQFNSQTQQAKVSNLFIVDLAGSQKVSRTGAEGKILQQAKKINLSLTSLAKVIKSLSQKIPHIPYRDSKLTRIVQDSLGGNSKTTLILNCSPSECNASETISTLRFGETAQKIKNKPKINRQPTIKQLQNIIIRLESKIKFKDQWILMLQAHIKNKFAIPLPKKQFLTRIKSLQKLQGSNEQVNTPTSMQSISFEDYLNPQIIFSQFKANLDKYLYDGLKTSRMQPQIENINIRQTLLSDSEQDERISILESQLVQNQNNLNRETIKHNLLKQQYEKLKQDFNQILQQNKKYQIKESQYEQMIKKFKIDLEYLMGDRRQDVKNAIQIQRDIDNDEIKRLRQLNQLVTADFNLVNSEKCQLEFKIKQKERKICQLKQMLRQIQEQMQLIEEQQDQPLNFNTKIANPIKRSTIICQ